MNFLEKNKTFIRFTFSAGSSFFLDLILFTVFNFVLGRFIGYEAILISTLLARIISSFYNFIINSKFVFEKYSKKAFLKYYGLVIIQMMLSGFIVYFINKFLIDTLAVFIKFVVDIILFIINYFVQKLFIFK